jgi:Uma2 family endonuclease
MIVRANFKPVVKSLAGVVHDLGGIPLNRIRAKPAPGTATAEDLLKAPKPICELIDGVLVEKAVGDRGSLLAAEILSLIRNHVRAGDLGVVLGEAGYFILEEGRQIRAPDVSFTPWSAFPNEEIPEEAYWSVTPALVVEVLSPSNTKAEIDRKLTQFFAAGTELAWVVDPKTQSAKVHTSPKRFKEIGPSGTLDGGKVLPGFKLPLADLFAVTKRRKKKSR